ncbi:hypothetical protein TruAng_002944 [Truncatella angustata]|nr:hypothetical protein TruAng_002944 [Truncatella angustata]
MPSKGGNVRGSKVARNGTDQFGRKMVAECEVIFEDQTLLMPRDHDEVRIMLETLQEDGHLCFKMRWYVARHIRATHSPQRQPSMQIFATRLRQHHQWQKKVRYGHIVYDKLIALNNWPINRLDFEAQRVQSKFHRGQDGWQYKRVTQILEQAYRQYNWHSIIDEGIVDRVLLEAGADLNAWENATILNSNQKFELFSGLLVFPDKGSQTPKESASEAARKFLLSRAPPKVLESRPRSGAPSAIRQDRNHVHGLPCPPYVMPAAQNEEESLLFTPTRKQQEKSQFLMSAANQEESLFVTPERPQVMQAGNNSGATPYPDPSTQVVKSIESPQQPYAHMVDEQKDYFFPQDQRMTGNLEVGRIEGDAGDQEYMQALQHRAGDLNHNIAEYQHGFIQQQSGIVELEHKASQQQHRIIQLEHEILQQQHKLIKYENDNAEHQRRIDNYEHEIAQNQRRIYDYEHGVVQYQRRIDEFEHEASQQQRRNADVEHEHHRRTSDFEHEATRYQHRIEEFEHEISTLKSEITDYLKTTSDLNKENGELREYNQKLRGYIRDETDMKYPEYTTNKRAKRARK